MKRSQTEEREGKELRRGGGGDGGAWGREEKRRIVAYVATTLFTRLLLRKQLRVLCRYFVFPKYCRGLSSSFFFLLMEMLLFLHYVYSRSGVLLTSLSHFWQVLFFFLPWEKSEWVVTDFWGVLPRLCPSTKPLWVTGQWQRNQRWLWGELDSGHWVPTFFHSPPSLSYSPSTYLIPPPYWVSLLIKEGLGNTRLLWSSGWSIPLPASQQKPAFDSVKLKE